MGREDDGGVALAVVALPDGRALMLRRVAPEGSLRWAFPGGKVEPGERPEEACVREAMEETGVACRPVRCLGTRAHPGTGREMTYWLCERESGEPTVREPGKADRVGWFTPGEVDALAGGRLFAPVGEALAALADGRAPTGT